MRTASRAGSPPFDWDSPATWPAMLDGVTSVYIAYSPDLTIPGAVETVERFCAEAVRSGVEKFVLLAGRGEKEAEAAEDVVKASGARWTIIRASWFNQNFSEAMLLPSVLAGTIALPTGTVAEPFVDIEDIADVAVASLIDPAHDSRTYDVTGPRLMTFGEAADELSVASGRAVSFVHVSGKDFVVGCDGRWCPPVTRRGVGRHVRGHSRWPQCSPWTRRARSLRTTSAGLRNLFVPVCN